MNDQKNMLIAIGLSALVLLGWQYFVGLPQMDKQRHEAQLKQPPASQQTTQPASGAPVPAQPGAVPASTAQPSSQATREAVLAASPRIAIDTGNIKGSIALKGARIDDVALIRFRETVDPASPPIVLLAPSGAPHPFYAEFGWVAASGVKATLPNANTVWTQEGSGPLSAGRPVTLTYDNGEGLVFRRVISIDDKFLFTVEDSVANKTETPVSLFPYALVSRHGTPHTQSYYILHEGLIGVFGDQGLKEVTYSAINDAKEMTFKTVNAWFGITDKYWAATLLPETSAHLQARFSASTRDNINTYQTDYLLDAVTIAPGASGSAKGRLFAGAKEVAVIDGYDRALNLNRFELLIDWGWFYFITKPMFQVIDWLFRWLGNFGLAILTVTVIIKGIFFPLANKSYASMAKMKAVQPEMVAIRERYPDDKVKQQQMLMELYKTEKINPLAGCLPIVIQIPVFFALYKVLFVTIEMRHAPFFGWIRDLAAPDPTTIFNLFGLIPWDPTVVPVIGSFLHLGVWPIVMGITMWLQMKLNPAPPDPTQKMIFDWMPLIFTFMLANFPAGLVIYWAWNNTLSVAQQSIIMRKHGAKIELWDNVRDLFGKKKDRASS
jgi:YidC/Oxa1 family membrane protein insertase